MFSLRSNELQAELDRSARMREAEKERLLRTLGRPSSGPVLRTIRRVGTGLVRLGVWLQAMGAPRERRPSASGRPVYEAP